VTVPGFHYRQFYRFEHAGILGQPADLLAWSWRSGWWWTMPSWSWKISTGAWRRKANPPWSPPTTGTRQVGFAVIATSVVLVAVFVPIAFLQGDVGRLFSEFAITMAAAVCFSSIVALSLSPMLASKILKRKTGGPDRAPVWTAFSDPSATATAVCSAAP
jgi:hypothetical protein